MKNGLAKLSLMMITAALLTSCQRASSLNKTTYQTQANAVLAKMVNTVSAPARAAKATPRTAILGIGSGQFDFFGQSPWENRYSEATPEGTMSACLRLLSGMEYDNVTDAFYISALIKCGNAIQSFYNPASALAARYLGQDDNYRVSYLNAYSINSPWEDFAGNYRTNASQFSQRTNFGFNFKPDALQY